MENRWSDDRALEFIERYSGYAGEDIALRIYTSRLLGGDRELVLHGGGNTSVKREYTNILGESVPAIFIKASGYDMAEIEFDGFTGLDLSYLRKLKNLPDLSDKEMINEFRTHMFDSSSATPSLETLVHAFIPDKFIDHTHPEAVLSLTNQLDADKILKEALSEDIAVLEYIKPGFKLAKAVLNVLTEKEGRPKAIILKHHGLITWGDTARESYEKSIEIVTKAELYIKKNSKYPITVLHHTDESTAFKRYRTIAPVLRGLLSDKSREKEGYIEPVILRPLINRVVLDFVDSSKGEELAMTPPITTDYLIRTKPFPLFLEGMDFNDHEKMKKHLSAALSKYHREYELYINRCSSSKEGGITLFDSFPRVILVPGLGAICSGKNISASVMISDITEQNILVKINASSIGTYKGLEENDLFGMEYRTYQHAKLSKTINEYMTSRVAVVTGAAGAIGSGLCTKLLETGCHVAASDLPGENLDRLCNTLQDEYGDRVMALPMDVTDSASVKNGFNEIIMKWGGVDLVVINAGVAHVSTLAEMDVEAFRRLERVNVEGTLFVLSESARIFETQGIGGDIVLISTKNVFAPGAGFGAYSATKAASHQLARIASLELASQGVRVNMVSPDAVFSEGNVKSGLWKEVGPGRMRARGLDEKGLEEYYRKRNLLKAKITAGHVASAVLYFATRQSPTTGATIPVDGGLPDAAPR